MLTQESISGVEGGCVASRQFGMAHIAGAVMGSRRHGGYRGSLFSPAKALHGDDDGPPKCMVALFALAGVGLLFTGVTYGYDSFWNPRSLAIRPYNKAVDTWNGGERQYLQESEFYFRAYSPRAVTVTVPAVTCKKGDTECTPVPAHEETTYKEVEPTDAYADTVPWLPFAGVVKNDSLAHDQINTDLKAPPLLPPPNPLAPCRVACRTPGLGCRVAHRGSNRALPQARLLTFLAWWMASGGG